MGSTKPAHTNACEALIHALLDELGEGITEGHAERILADMVCHWQQCGWDDEPQTARDYADIEWVQAAFKTNGVDIYAWDEWGEDHYDIDP